MLLDRCPHNKLELVMDPLENSLEETGEQKVPGSNLTNNKIFIIFLARRNIRNDTRKNAKVNLIYKISNLLLIEF